MFSDKKAKAEKIEPEEEVTAAEVDNLPVETQQPIEKPAPIIESNEMAIKSAPIVLYKVSSEWLDNLLSNVKREVMAKAIKHRCPAEFLDCLNSIELNLSDEAQFSLNMAESQLAAENAQEKAEAPKQDKK